MPTGTELEHLTAEAKEIWNQNAEFWDEKMGDGNLFFRHLLQPSTERLLNPRPGQQLLDIACGNGVFARWLAERGAHVVACDASERFIERARARSSAHADRIEYRVLDATQREQLLSLGRQRFDGILCSMALMDLPVIEPLLEAVRELLKPTGVFVFSVQHPCFNNNEMSMLVEQEERGGELVTSHSVRLFEYLHIPPGKGLGIIGQPMPHYYFHRPLSELLTLCFRQGLVLDGVEEPALQGLRDETRATSWVNFEGIPPVFVGRMRPLPPRPPG